MTLNLTSVLTIGINTLNGSRISPGKGETDALPRAGHSARFSISGRRSGAVQSINCYGSTIVVC